MENLEIGSRDGDYLIVPHCTFYRDALETLDFVSSYFKNAGSNCAAIEKIQNNCPHGFWLIQLTEKNIDNTDFVYAILKSGMFRAWCELTVYTEGKEYFSIGMWDTFPLPYMTPTSPRWAEVEKRGQALRRREEGARQALDEFIDNLFVPIPPTHSLCLTALDEKYLIKCWRRHGHFCFKTSYLIARKNKDY